MDMFQDYRGIFSLSQEISFLGSGQFFVNMTIALVCGLLIALFYRWTHSRSKYSATFVNSLIALSMITTIVITVIGNNLARAFGLVGALSIIRFRMAIRDVQDIVFIFFALAVGMAAGVDLLLIPVAGTIFIGVVMLVLSRFSQVYGAPPKRREFALRFSFTPPGESGEEEGEKEVPYWLLLEKHCKRHELIRAKPSKSGDVLALSFSVVLKSDKSEDFVRELGQIPGVTRVVLKKRGSKQRKRGKPR